MECIAPSSLSLFTFSFKKVPPVWDTWYHISYSSCITVSLRPSSKSSTSNANVNFKTADSVVKIYSNKSALFYLATDSAVPLCNCLWFVGLRERQSPPHSFLVRERNCSKALLWAIIPKVQVEILTFQTTFLFPVEHILNRFLLGELAPSQSTITLVICYWLGKYEHISNLKLAFLTQVVFFVSSNNTAVGNCFSGG